LAFALQQVQSFSQRFLRIFFSAFALSPVPIIPFCFSSSVVGSLCDFFEFIFWGRHGRRALESSNPPTVQFDAFVSRPVHPSFPVTSCITASMLLVGAPAALPALIS